MNKLIYQERIAIMRILQDIILADNKIDEREKILFSKIADLLELNESAKQDVDKQNSLLALTIIHDFTQEPVFRCLRLPETMIIPHIRFRRSNTESATIPPCSRSCWTGQRAWVFLTGRMSAVPMWR